MKKSILVLVFLAVIIIVLAAVLFWPQNKTAVITNDQKLTADIEVFLPKENELVESPLKITGVARGNGWTGFEGQVGTVKLIDSTGKELATGILRATTEWTTLPTYFETNLEFKATEEMAGSLVFKNENASGDPSRDNIFVLPVTFK